MGRRPDETGDQKSLTSLGGKGKSGRGSEQDGIKGQIWEQKKGATQNKEEVNEYCAQQTTYLKREVIGKRTALESVPKSGREKVRNVNKCHGESRKSKKETTTLSKKSRPRVQKHTQLPLTKKGGESRGKSTVTSIMLSKWETHLGRSV